MNHNNVIKVNFKRSPAAESSIHQESNNIINVDFGFVRMGILEQQFYSLLEELNDLMQQRALLSHELNMFEDTILISDIEQELMNQIEQNLDNNNNYFAYKKYIVNLKKKRFKKTKYLADIIDYGDEIFEDFNNLIATKIAELEDLIPYVAFEFARK